ncbi:MAG: SGNH/GDSL hydrolase family protein [Planctomycetes bacterium]|nr:SGNH/GDSL hydrolase family protein [Planctomycetota bacterium]
MPPTGPVIAPIPRRRFMRNWMWTVVSVTALSSMVLAGGNFELAPAKLFHARDGLGNVFAKLKSGKDVRIAYFGGSITAARGWRVKTLKWFQEQYPKAKVSEINAAIGGTGSNLGVYRFQQDVLQHKPDLIFVEFSVNDGGAKPENIYRGMEGVIRQAWKTDPTVDICYVYTFRVGYEKDLDKGLCPRAASADEKLAEYYGIPSINMAMRVAEMAREDKLIFKGKTDAKGRLLPGPEGVIVFSKDGVHPVDVGHKIYLDVIADALKEMEPESKPGPHELKKPFIADNWEKAKLVPLDKGMLSAGWKKLSSDKGLGKRFHNRMPDIWEATQPGETISFKFRGTAVSLYDLVGPDGGQAVITLDGETRKPRPRFDRYCSYHRISMLSIGQGLEDKVHTVKVEIHPEQPDRSIVTDREKNKPNFDPKKYDGTVLRVASIMIIGDIVKN